MKFEASKKILSKIMTVQEYVQTRHEPPYIFNVKKDEKELLYFGTRHTRNPEEDFLGKIQNEIEVFGPDIIFVEGMAGLSGDKRIAFEKKLKSETQDQIVKQMGESGFALKLALENDIPWHSPVAPLKEKFNTLEKSFSRKDIFGWEVLHILPQYHRGINKSVENNFEKYIERYIYRFKEMTNWSSFDYSYASAVDHISEVLGREFSPDSWDQRSAVDLVDPIPWEGKAERQTVFNLVGRASSYLRDEYIVSEIVRHFNNYDKVFVLYGATHAVMQENALREFFTS